MFYCCSTFFWVSSHFSCKNTLSCSYTLQTFNPKLLWEGDEPRTRTKAVQMNAAVVTEFSGATLRNEGASGQRCLKMLFVFAKSYISQAKSNASSHKRCSVKEMISPQHFKQKDFQQGVESLFPHLHESTEGSH